MFHIMVETAKLRTTIVQTSRPPGLAVVGLKRQHGNFFPLCLKMEVKQVELVNHVTPESGPSPNCTKIPNFTLVKCEKKVLC